MTIMLASFDEHPSDMLQERSPKEQPNAHARAFKLLYSLTLFQICNGDPDGPTVLSELDECFEKIFGEKEDSDNASSEYLVEILMAFASKRSALLRKVSQQVFAAFANDVKAGGLQLLFDVSVFEVRSLS